MKPYTTPCKLFASSRNVASNFLNSSQILHRFHMFCFKGLKFPCFQSWLHFREQKKSQWMRLRWHSGWSYTRILYLDKNFVTVPWTILVVIFWSIPKEYWEYFCSTSDWEFDLPYEGMNFLLFHRGFSIVVNWNTLKNLHLHSRVTSY